MLLIQCKTSLTVREVWVSVTRQVKSNTVLPTAGTRGDISLELYCPGAKPQKWIPPSLHAPVQHCEYNEGLIFF